MAKGASISGFPEWLPSERVVEQRVIDTLREVFELNGFIGIETRAVEQGSSLLKKGETSKEIYLLSRLQEVGHESDTPIEDRLGLHFDLTVPLSRYVVEHSGDLAFPFKRWQIQKVWRGERPQEGRFREFVQADIDVIGKKMTIVGAGGAATAIEIQAALDGVAEIVIFNRKDEFWDRAVSTVEKINTRTSSHAVLYDLAELDKLKEEMNDSYLFVNATGVGMKPLEGQSVVPDKSYFRPELIVVDVPYSPLETKMRSMAKEVGCKTMNGLGMMLFQGSAAFELWTGEPMPIEHMKEVLNIKYD